MSWERLKLAWPPVAFGVGWQQFDLSTIGLDGDTSGARVTAEARASIGVAYVYGQASYQPSLDDAPASDLLGGVFEDLSAYEVELGVSWQFMPLMSLRAGYRQQSVDFTRSGTISGDFNADAESSGFLVGFGAHF